MQLMVHDKPFIVLGGELHNSSSSSASYMEREVWPYLKQLHLNTVVAPVFWELLEEKENEFDFSHVQELLEQARREGVKLVLLWFGLWKNGMSTYVPPWMKKKSELYFRVRDEFGRPINAISPCCQAAVQKDAAAFRRLMAYLRLQDEEENTVLMVQVENEMGILGAARDYSSVAEALFQEEVPPEIARMSGAEGTWGKVYSHKAAETFMAWAYASATQVIAQAGKEEYALPLYVNAWLDQHPFRAGCYPSGGPVAGYLALWQAIAPDIDFLSPDIYLSQFATVCDAYTALGNPLFIPEARASMDSASNVFLAVAGYSAIGFAPFAIEDLVPEKLYGETMDWQLLESLNINKEAFDTRGAAAALSQSYKVLNNVAPLLVEHQGSARLQGFAQELEPGEMLRFDDYDIRVDYSSKQAHTPKGGGLALQIDADTFLLAGLNCQFEFLPKEGEQEQVTFFSLEEGEFQEGEWVRERRLNGDEFHARLGTSAKILRCRVCKYNA